MPYYLKLVKPCGTYRTACWGTQKLHFNTVSTVNPSKTTNSSHNEYQWVQ